MKQVVVDCDGATIPRDVPTFGVERRSLRHRGERANLTLKMVSPSNLLLNKTQDKAVDLIRVGSYVYAADQSVSRGGEADAHGDAWKREFTVVIPVSIPDFWNSKDVNDRLSEVLNFASGDYWHFRFTRASEEYGQLPIELDSSQTTGNPDSVYLFSGGLDSLCAVVEATEVLGKRPLLVGHSPAFNIRGRQANLVRALRSKYKDKWSYPYIGAPIHRVGSDPSDYTQRTRAFLYSCLGAVVADGLGLNEVNLADNGVVSISLPINHQLRDARASRSTHPKFITLFNRLLSAVLANAPAVTNPLWSRTRPEAIGILKKIGAVELLEETNSCSHPRYLTKAQSHCGVCSQCIDRRFATIASELEEYDPPEHYKVDIFRQALGNWKEQTMALDYVRFATTVEGLDDTGLFREFSGLYECVEPNDPSSQQVAESLVALLRRHAATVSRVMEDQIGLARKELAHETLPPTSLIRLLAGSGQVGEAFRHSTDYRTCWLEDEEFAFTLNQARVIELLDQERLKVNVALSQDFILETLEITSKNLSQVFRSCKNWRHLVVKGVRRGTFKLNVYSQ